VGIVLGTAFAEALGDKRGITRYGSILLPMDEALVVAAVDLSGRSYLGFALDIPTSRVGDFDTELVEEFWLAFSRKCECNLHLRTLAGSNSHHVIEGAFKAAARALRAAVAIDEAHRNELPSTKGVL
jgi:imidazoleglycerol-phosphate dehydratase